MCDLLSRAPTISRTLLVTGLLLVPLGHAAPASAQDVEWARRSGPPYEKYFQMSCGELSLEYRFLRKELVRLQTPANLASPRWNDVSHRFAIVSELYYVQKSCERARSGDLSLPPPQPVAGTPSEVREAGLAALRLFRFTTAEAWLRQAAEAGDTEAKYQLGILSRMLGRADESKAWLEAAASEGSQKARDALRSMSEPSSQ